VNDMGEGRTAEGAALFDIVVEVSRTFFRLRAAGSQIGAVSPWGGGLWGFLRSLQVRGPQTVPQIARARPVSRQRIQRLADETAESGLVEFTDNPAHRRSKLVRLTPEGATLVRQLTEKIADISEDLAHGMDEQELRTTAKVLRRLREKLEAA
jgi:DNA-binding MarR family transcriptional regulator